MQAASAAGALSHRENSIGIWLGVVLRARTYAEDCNCPMQIPIFELLHKFDSSRVHDDIKNGRRRYRLTRLPSYLVLHFKRFTKNNFFWEKNPTIVNFPVRNLELRDVIPIPTGVHFLCPNVLQTCSLWPAQRQRSSSGSCVFKVQLQISGDAWPCGSLTMVNSCGLLEA